MAYVRLLWVLTVNKIVSHTHTHTHTLNEKKHTRTYARYLCCPYLTNTHLKTGNAHNSNPRHKIVMLVETATLASFTCFGYSGLISGAE